MSTRKHHPPRQHKPSRRHKATKQQERARARRRAARQEREVAARLRRRRILWVGVAIAAVVALVAALMLFTDTLASGEATEPTAAGGAQPGWRILDSGDVAVEVGWVADVR